MSEDNVKNTDEQTSKGQYGLTKESYKKLVHAIENGRHSLVRKLLVPLHAADVANFLTSISHDKRRRFVEIKSDDFDPEVLVELGTDVREEIIGLLGPDNSAKAITSLNTDDAVEVIEDLDKEDQHEILEAIPAEQRAQLREGLAYPEDSAGRLIQKEIICVPEFWTVGQTIDYLRSNKNLPDEFYQIFIVDPKQRPIGGVMLGKMMKAARHEFMKDLMEKDLKLIYADMDQEEVAFIFRQYGLASAPVVNEEGRMIGIITVDDVVDVIEEEAQEDIMHLGGIGEADLHSDFSQTMRRRFPWLAANLITAIAASVVIGMFEGTIQKLASLAVLMPIVASMGGNAGTQTLTIAVRAIATKELTSSNALRVIGKETLVGVLNGLVFAVIAGSLIFVWYHNFYLSIIFAVATIITLLLAGLAGALIPLGLEKIGVDPAVASGVVLTTVTDVAAFGVFLGLAAMVLL